MEDIDENSKSKEKSNINSDLSQNQSNSNDELSLIKKIYGENLNKNQYDKKLKEELSSFSENISKPIIFILDYVNTLEIEYSNLPFLISSCKREKEKERYNERLKIIKEIIDSEKYKELIEYFNKEETFEIYKSICNNEKFTYEDSKELEFIDNMDYFNFIINKPLHQNFIQRKEFDVTEVNTK